MPPVPRGRIAPMKEQMVFVLCGDFIRPASFNCDQLNALLAQGWRVAQVAPMGVSGGGDNQFFHASAVVVLER